MTWCQGCCDEERPLTSSPSITCSLTNFSISAHKKSFKNALQQRQKSGEFAQDEEMVFVSLHSLFSHLSLKTCPPMEKPRAKRP